MADAENKFKKNTLKNEEKESPAPEKKATKTKKVKESKETKAEPKPQNNVERFAFLKDERFHKVA